MKREPQKLSNEELIAQYGLLYVVDSLSSGTDILADEILRRIQQPAARIAELEAALQNSRIALTFYRQWLLDANPQAETAYPFGKKAEEAARALLEES